MVFWKLLTLHAQQAFERAWCDDNVFSVTSVKKLIKGRKSFLRTFLGADFQQLSPTRSHPLRRRRVWERLVAFLFLGATARGAASGSLPADFTGGAGTR
jgi:hypothetical protein